MNFHFKKNKLLNVQGSAPHITRAIIIGTQRSGCAALAQFLDFHPNIRTREDYSYIDPNFAAKEKLVYRKGLWNIDRSQAYFTHGSTLAFMIQKMNPNIKLIVVVRNPIKKLLSHYQHLKVIVFIYRDGLNNNIIK